MYVYSNFHPTTYPPTSSPTTHPSVTHSSTRLLVIFPPIHPSPIRLSSICLSTHLSSQPLSHPLLIHHAPVYHPPIQPSPLVYPPTHPSIHHLPVFPPIYPSTNSLTPIHPSIRLLIHSLIQQILTGHCCKPVPCLSCSKTYLYLLEKMLCSQVSVPLKTLYLVFGMIPPPQIIIPPSLFGQLLPGPQNPAHGQPDWGSCHGSSSVGPWLV